MPSLGKIFYTSGKISENEGRAAMVGGQRGYARYSDGKEVKVKVPEKKPVSALPGSGGQRAMRDAFKRLEMAKEQYGFAAFGQEGVEMERIYNRLKDQLEGGGKRKDRDEARKAVLADAQRRRGNFSDEQIIEAADAAVQQALYERRPKTGLKMKQVWKYRVFTIIRSEDWQLELLIHSPS